MLDARTSTEDFQYSNRYKRFLMNFSLKNNQLVINLPERLTNAVISMFQVNHKGRVFLGRFVPRTGSEPPRGNFPFASEQKKHVTGSTIEKFIVQVVSLENLLHISFEIYNRRLKILDLMFMTGNIC